MKRSTQADAATVVALGALAGARSMLPLAVVSRALGSRGAPRLRRPLSRWVSPRVQNLALLAALLELIGDKLPSVPARIAPLPLAGRALSGAAAGFLIARGRRRGAGLFTALGASCAVAAAIGSYALRKSASERLPLSSAQAGLLEDGAALLGAGAVARRLSGPAGQRAIGWR